MDIRAVQDVIIVGVLVVLAMKMVDGDVWGVGHLRDYLPLTTPKPIHP